MRLSVPTNWDDELLRTFCDPQVDEVYGKLASDIFGGGRATYLSSFVSKRACARHIRLIRDRGIPFNYLLNSTCLDNREWTRGWQNSMSRFLDWLARSGVDRLTIGTPYVLELVKKRFPHFKVGIATGAHVDSLRRAKFWVDLGADSLTLSEVRVNRNFQLIKAIRSSVNCELKLIANNACLQYCPFSFYHSVCNAHASTAGKHSRFFIDYCRLRCRSFCFSDPVSFLKTTWIRPEDMEFYRCLGIDTFKLVDRVMPTRMLKLIIESYAKHSYEGNLMDLLTGVIDKNRYSRLQLLSRARFFFHPFKVNIFSFGHALKDLNNCRVYIENKALDGFIRDVYNTDCKAVDCRQCGVCARFAAKAMRYDQEELLTCTKSYRFLLQGLISGSFFNYSKRR